MFAHKYLRRQSTERSTERQERGQRARGRRMIGIIAALVTAFGGSVALAPTASATSSSCAMWGHGIRWGVQNGQFCTTLNGSGTWVSDITGNYSFVVPGIDQVCNPQMKVDFFNAYGQYIGVTRYGGISQWGCINWGNWGWGLPSIPVYLNMPSTAYGYARISLLSWGSPVAIIRIQIRP